tara:strand:+ start:158 stop:592 length:435 start_codon:yes stop_codon:yes gene_type:complete
MSKEEQPYKEVTTGQEQPKKKGLVEEIQEMKATGNTKSPEFRAKIKELEVILGVPQLSPFKTNELDIFEENLKEMDVTDMMRMAKEAGLNPVLDKPRMRKALLREFKAYSRNNRRNIAPNPVQQMELDPNNPAHAEVLKILRDI